MSWFLDFLLALPAILWAITVHEYAHAVTAYRLGDHTPRWAGRLTLNPVAHIDVIGFIALVLVHFGWAKPVEVNPLNFHRVAPKKGMLLVAVAGPTANFLSAVACAVAVKLLPIGSMPAGVSEPAYYMLQYGVFINVAFGVFNFLPIPPLDGSKVLEYFLPPALYYSYKRIEPYSFLILILFIATPLLEWTLLPIVTLITRLLL